MDSDPRELPPIERYEKRAAHFWEEVRRLEGPITRLFELAPGDSRDRSCVRFPSKR
jgi:hypothetical protein